MMTLYLHLTDGEARALAHVLGLIEDASEVVLYKRGRVAQAISTGDAQQLLPVLRMAREQLRQGGHGR